MADTKPLTDDERWRIALAKDRRFDGVFVTGVHSTGIYCRPSCPARPPKRENVRFYSDCEAAEAAGLRACKRCAPDQQSREEAAVLAALKVLREAEEMVSLERLGQLTDYSPTHFQRIFTRAVGLSPAAYQRALRRERAEEALGEGGSVTGAIYEAGYGAPSRFYENRKDSGMSASDWKDGGKGRTVHWSVIETTLGDMLVAATGKGVCCLSFGEGEAELRARFPKAELVEAGEDFRALFEQVTAAVENPATATHSDIPLDVKGTAFQQRCWDALRQIPAGETRSYGEQAAMLGNPKASRAVGGANGANNIAVLIPCHRVVPASGGVGGYAYGTEIKAELLRREKGE
ncbi:bifunctional transcriptional activator/DNA repair enzyme AdaA [Qipengyuania vesicularis]|uniref:bifunctional transcriptional activator/DNA repair enzyme AdaA n=1 Tax=Qipengyuania vesicularis TaxID=2867232 RepID=UPI001C88CAAC|nr:methylated-DNA--[protein]-cysteine S-methyltransferase [Qipengyuania vesicularis]MBX7527307.1 methylated-DNA--[protein]-cysteine S-methyltransferase [Qipengyuania vesicularis]